MEASNTANKAIEQEKFAKFQAEMEWLEEPEEGLFVSKLDLVKKKIKQNPLVPIGCIATATVLGLGLSNVWKDGGQKRSQILMRWRVGLQSATIAALVIGIFYEQYSHSKAKNP